mmetsp:Transcript_24814/g.36598  ORF Transcript_24814/g.36598 Transcript_24814/m.36598 type:complete len:351 (+) Transcript_24814:121-1173(+)
MDLVITIIVATIFSILLPKLLCILDNSNDIWTNRPPPILARIFYVGVRRFAKFWHQYEIHGIEHISKKNCLLVGYHSRCTVDGVYATAFTHSTTIMSPIFFAVPFSKYLFKQINCVSTHSEGASSRESFINTVVHGDRPTLLFPGGHHECYKPAADKHIVKWKKLPGYARILLSDDQPGRTTSVVPFYTHNCEDIYWTSEWWYDFSGKNVMKDFKDFENGKLWLLPFIFPKSLAALGCIILPLPVKLDLYFGEPVIPNTDESPTDFAERVRQATQELIDSVRKKHRENGNKEERSVSYMLQRYPIYALYVIIQNTLMWSTFVLLNSLLVPFIMLFSIVLSEGRKTLKKNK